MDCFENNVLLLDGLLANETVAKYMTRADLEDIMQPEHYTGDAIYYVDKVIAEVNAAREKDEIK